MAIGWLPIALIPVPESTEIDKRSDKKFRQSFIMTQAAETDWKPEIGTLPRYPRVGFSWSLKWDEGEGRSVGLARGVAYMVCPPALVVLSAGITGSTLSYLCSGTSEAAVRFWPSCILLFMISPNCSGMQLFLAPYSFFVSVAWEEVCPCVSTAAKGPRSQAQASELVLPWRSMLRRSSHGGHCWDE